MTLQANNVTFTYRGRHGAPVLQNISLTIQSGERVGLKAPSGRGKTTLCRLLAGYERPQSGQVLLDGQEVLEGFGFQLEEFGAGSIAVRAVPDYLETGDVEPTLLELAKKLRLTGWADPSAARDEVMHTMACKAAIKGGQKNSPGELYKVAEAVMSGAVKYCPHGRPVAIELTRQQLEKQFKRS